MNRHEFDRAVVPMLKALGIHTKTPKAQVDLLWEHYRKQNHLDFMEACKYLGRGNTGYIPKQEVFDAAVLSAREMRLVHEKDKDKKDSNTWMKHGHPPIGGMSPEDRLWGKLCSLNLRVLVLRKGDILTREQREAVSEIEAGVARDDIIKSQGHLRIDNLHPCQWLTEQINTFKKRWPNETFANPNHTAS